MIRAAAAALLVAALVTSGSAPSAKMSQRFGAEDCRRVAIVDAATGLRVVGAEDMVLAPDGATVIVSAHDRLDSARPDGGLYAVPVHDLGRAPVVTVLPLVDRDARALPFRPHGIALAPGGRRLALVNRVALHDAVVEIGSLGQDGWQSDTVIRHPRLCRANDLAFDGDGESLTVTIDRTDCEGSLRDILPGARTGALGRIDGGAFRIVRTGISFPNGIAAGTVAETRGRALLRPDGRIVALPGAPDNLSADGDALIVPVHPVLLRLSLYLNGWSDRAPSRILRVTHDDRIELLFDDPDGGIFSGATAAVMVGGALIAGSARDSGLLVCGAPA